MLEAPAPATQFASYYLKRFKRIPLTAEQKHAVNLRDQGRCTYLVRSPQVNYG